MNKIQRIFNQIKDDLSIEERGVLRLVFDIYKNDYKTEEEFKQAYHLDTEGVREALRGALKKHKKEIDEMERASNTIISSNIWVKMGDIVEVEMQMDEPVLDKKTNEMKREYFIRYSLGDEEIKSFSYNEEYDEDCNYDICDYISDYIKSNIGVTEYEIFNGDFYGDNQFAELRVKAIGNSWRNL